MIKTGRDCACCGKFTQEEKYCFSCQKCRKDLRAHIEMMPRHIHNNKWWINLDELLASLEEVKGK